MMGSMLDSVHAGSGAKTRKCSAKWVVACIALVQGLALVTACDSSDEGAATACNGIGMSRTLSETCCLDHGLDACGAGLVCAALDGRTVPTCYAEGLRIGGQQCTVNSLCASRSCSPGTMTCVSLLGESCNVTAGCTSITTERVACSPAVNNGVLDRTKYSCKLVVAGMECGACLVAADCPSATQVCNQGICTNAAGVCP